MSNKCHLIQHGEDGFGHQLHGLFSTLILHNIKNYYFDGIAYCNKPFKFQHIKGEVEDTIKKYLIEAIYNFLKDHDQIKINYNNYIFSHEIYKIPDNFDSNILYGIDNAYYFNKINFNNEERILHKKNIEKYKKYFIDNKYLPNKRLNDNNIVIHVRLGDALHDGRRNELLNFNKKIVKIIDKLIINYPNYKIYVHSNGNPDFLNNYDYTFFPESTPLINVLSDLINAKIFLCGTSSLSKISCFLGNQEKIIIPDDTKHSMPENCITMSDYLN